MRFGPCRVPVFALVALVAFTGLGDGASAATPAPLSVAARRDVSDVLERTRTWRDVPRGADDLVRMGPAVIPELFELLVLWAEPNRTASEDPDAAKLATIRRTMVLTAIGRLPWDRARAFLVGLSEGRLDGERRAQAMHLLGRLGTSGELALLTSLGSGTTPAEVAVDRPLRDAFDATLARILQRDPGGVAALAPLFDTVHPSLIESLVRCIGDTGTGEAALVLASVLGKHDDVDALVLTRLAGMSVSEGDRGAEVADLVRDQLGRMDERVVVLAALVETNLRDHEAVPALIELMDRPEQRVHRAASTALTELTGKPFGTDRSAWIRWYDAELSWWQEGMQTDLGRLQTGSFNEAASVIRRAATHRLFTDELARMLAHGLERREHQLVEMTCLALASVGSRAVLPDLVACLEHPNLSVRAVAAKSLARITGKSLPADVEVWRQELGLP